MFRSWDRVERESELIIRIGEYPQWLGLIVIQFFGL